MTTVSFFLAALLALLPAREAAAQDEIFDFAISEEYLASLAREEQGSASGRRPRIPDRVTCPRNNLTSFTGRVLSFSRTNVCTVIRMRTDEDTTETFTLHHPKSNDAKKWFLLRGKPFEGSDWALIESARNRLWPNMRATVWVCDDGINPMVDWQPPNGGENLPFL